MMDECNCVCLDNMQTVLLLRQDSDLEACEELSVACSDAFAGKYPHLPRFQNYWLTGTKDGIKGFTLSLWKGSPAGHREAILTAYFASDRVISRRLWESISIVANLATGALDDLPVAPNEPWIAIKKENAAKSLDEYDSLHDYLLSALPWSVISTVSLQP